MNHRNEKAEPRQPGQIKLPHYKEYMNDTR
jgi:hypothetical protein